MAYIKLETNKDLKGIFSFPLSNALFVKITSSPSHGAQLRQSKENNYRSGWLFLGDGSLCDLIFLVSLFILNFYLETMMGSQEVAKIEQRGPS